MQVLRKHRRYGNTDFIGGNITTEKDEKNSRILVVALEDTKRLDEVLEQLNHTVIIMAGNQKKLKDVADKILSIGGK